MSLPMPGAIALLGNGRPRAHHTRGRRLLRVRIRARRFQKRTPGARPTPGKWPRNAYRSEENAGPNGFPLARSLHHCPGMHRQRKHTLKAPPGLWSSASRVWWLVVCLEVVFTGCGTPILKEDPHLRAVTQGLDRIETVSLQEQSLSKPISVQEGLAEAAEEAAEPNRAAPTVKLTLEEVRAAALANNLDLKVALIDPSTAQLALDAERAKFEWVFFGSAAYTHDEFIEDSNTVSASRRSYEAGVTAPLQTGGLVTTSVPVESSGGVADAAVSVFFFQSLLRGAGTRINTQSIRIAEYDKGRIDALTKLRAIGILAEADIAYWQLYMDRKELEVSREQYKLAEDQLTYAQRMVEAGSAARIEIVRAESGLAGALDAVISAETGVRDAERRLKQIMNRQDLPVNSPTGIITLTEPDPRGLKLNADVIVAAALKNRMEMVESELQLAIDDMYVELARNDVLPQLDLDYRYTAGKRAGGTGHALGDIFDHPDERHAVRLSATIPLGNQAARARLRQARLNKVRTEVDRQRLEQQIRREVYQAIAVPTGKTHQPRRAGRRRTPGLCPTAAYLRRGPV
jgi:outer membrane protein